MKRSYVHQNGQQTNVHARMRVSIQSSSGQQATTMNGSYRDAGSNPG